MRFLAIAALAIMPAAAEAATYTLSGSGVTGCTAGEFEDCSRFDGASLDGKIIIKGARLGGLAWRNLVWEVNGAGESVGLPLRLLNLALPDPNSIPGFPRTLEDSFNAPLNSSRFSLRTGRRGQVLNWSLEILNGPPDYMLGSDGMTLYAGDAVWRGTGGTLTRGGNPHPQAAAPHVAEAPIPAAGMLLLGGMGLLGFMKLPRRRG